MQYLYMGNCNAPIPSTGHVFTEPKLPFVPKNPNHNDAVNPNHNVVNPYNNNVI